jgi:hypothetical protein
MAWSERKKGWVMVGAFCGMLVAGLAMAVVQWMRAPRIIDLDRADFDTIEYRGHDYKLTRKYKSFTQYKNDPDNLVPGQEETIVRALTGAPIKPTYANSFELINDITSVQFPGYGIKFIGGKARSDGKQLSAFAIEIPRAEKDRILVFRVPAEPKSDAPQDILASGPCELLDDFVAPADSRIMSVDEEAGQLVYRRSDGAEIIRRAVQKP